MRKIIREFKQKKEGITAGAVVGAIIVFYMNMTGEIAQATIPPGGLIEEIGSIPLDDLVFIKLLLTAIIIGGFVGYIIQDKLIGRKG